LKLDDLYTQFLALTGEPAAAATLVLAHVQSQLRAGSAPSANSDMSDRLLNVAEAAEYLGYSPTGLRRIVEEQRIQYVQNGRGPIKFRREWLDEFISANVTGPQDVERSPAQKRTAASAVEPRFGFDPKLFRRNVA
jgi:excisionase family DNA binding protein